MISILVSSEMLKVEVRLINFGFSLSSFRLSDSVDDRLIASSGLSTAGDMIKNGQLWMPTWHSNDVVGKFGKLRSESS